MSTFRRLLNFQTSKFDYFMGYDIKVWLEEEAEVGDPEDVKKKLAELGIYTIKHLLVMDLDKHLECIQLKPYEEGRFVEAFERLKIYKAHSKENNDARAIKESNNSRDAREAMLTWPMSWFR